MKKGIKSLVMSIVAIVVSSAMLLGSTYAYFTDSVSLTGNKIVAGTLKVDLELLDKEGNWKSLKEDKTPLFNSDKWEPGCTDVKVLKVENEGTLPLKWKATFNYQGALSALADVIDVYVLPSATELTYPTDDSFEGYVKKGTIREFISSIEQTTTGILNAGDVAYLGLALKMQNVGNMYQGLKLCDSFDIAILATQLSGAEVGFNDVFPKFWNGTADTSWYDPENPKDSYDIGTAEQIAGLAELVSGDTTFAGVTFNLTADVDLYCEDTTPFADGDPLTFRPIGDKSKNGTFEGVFDGNGYTISNIYQNGWDLGYEWGIYGSYGLFGNVNDATIKNLTLTGGESYIEGGDTSFVAGSATGTCVFENITIKNSISATYNNGNGGIIGWSGEGNYTFKNITIAEDCVLAGLWGSFDSSIGGIVGQAEPGATYNFENVNVACRIDAYNDCTASYDYYNYRMCGMLIGRMEETTTIDGANYPDTSKYNLNFTNVIVTYGDWANYHYCEPTPSNMNGGRGMRVEPGYAYGGIPADYDHALCVENEKHMQLIPFDQIFGGDQIGVKGFKSYDGVTVIYNNKQS